MFRSCVILLALFGGMSFAQQPTAPSIQGSVIRASGEQPVAGARVELLGVEGGKVRSRTVTTGNDGRFTFRDLVAGVPYQIVVTGSGLQPTAYGQQSPGEPWTPITLTSGQQLTGIRITPQSMTAIRGKVETDKGRPLAGANVAVLRPGYLGGRRVLGLVTTTVTNLRGEYRFSGLPIGSYYIRVKPQNTLTAELYLINPAAEIDQAAVEGESVPRDEPEGYPVAYFPGTSLESAKPVQISDGTIAEDIDVRIAMVRTSRVRGTVTNAAGSAVAAKLLLVPDGGALESNWTRFIETRNGQFDLRGVLPGSYTLVADAVEGGATLSGQVPVQVGAEESKTIGITVTPRPAIRGRVSVEDWMGQEKPDLRTLLILLLPRAAPMVDGDLVGASHEVPSGRALPDADGNFTINEVRPWDYRVSISAVQVNQSEIVLRPLRGAYVKSIKLGDRDVLNEGAKVDGAVSGSLDVILGTTAAALDGRVVQPGGENAPFARVVLVPEIRTRYDLYQTATATDTGRFQFQSLAPGAYKLFAWQYSPEGAWLDPEYLGRYEEAGTRVEVAPDSAEHVELKIIR